MAYLEKLMLAQVALDAATFGYDQLYSYHVPDMWHHRICPGQRVAVPFGKGNHRRIGMVLALSEQVPVDADGKPLPLKPIAAVLDDESVLTAELLHLVEFLHDRTFCTWYDAVRAVLPGGMQLRLTEHYALTPQPEGVLLTDAERNLLHMLEKTENSQERDLLLQADAASDKETVIQALVEKGCLVAVTEGKQRIADSTRKMVRLTAAYREAPECFHPTPKQLLAVQVLEQHPALSAKECAYSAGVSEAVIGNLIKNGIAESFDMEFMRVPRDAVPTVSTAQTQLNAQQQNAYNAVSDAVLAERPAAFLLQGVTGSGKTVVFEKLIALTLQQGRQALLLVPEIALTPQVVQYFQARFGNRVVTIHSGLSLGQRFDTFKLIRRGEVDIVVGTRSAVFAPLDRIGIIILDEEGEHSYKADQSPRYHAADIAKERCKYHKAALLLASATPSLESRYLAEKGVYRLLTMTQRYNQAPLPTVQIVDMNQERMSGNGSPFSEALLTALQENLQKGEQSILLLNRRGFHTLMQCAKCREPIFCPNCSVPLTYHKANDRLICHYCGHIDSVVQVCPSCGYDHLIPMGFGTQRLEQELAELLPQARILRMDADTTMSRSAYEEGFRTFANLEYDILCGTQMIGKGLDFPKVTLVGVVSIDKALYAGDFRSYERTFSLITQVVGRGGRGVSPGRAILQTFMPDHYVLQLAAQQDYDSFYREEMALRRSLLFPPICDICMLGLASAWQDRAARAANRLAALLRMQIARTPCPSPLRVLGPVEAGHGKLNGKYRWRILLKCKNIAPMRTWVRQLLETAYADKAFSKVTLYADMNGDCDI